MFHGATLDGFEAEMVAGADAVCARLAAADGAPVDVFRLLGDGTNQRGLAVAQVEGGKIVVVEAAPSSFGDAGF